MGDRHFILTDNMAFVAPQRITTTAEVCAEAGIGVEGAIAGLVFEWGMHHGFNRSELWEWMRNVQK